jgi:hypothetical protein
MSIANTTGLNQDTVNQYPIIIFQNIASKMNITEKSHTVDQAFIQFKELGVDVYIEKMYKDRISQTLRNILEDAYFDHGHLATKILQCLVRHEDNEKVIEFIREISFFLMNPLFYRVVNFNSTVEKLNKLQNNI